MTTNRLNLAGLVVAGLLALVFFAPAHAGLYKCTDKNGRTYYQDKPCQDLIATRLPSWMSSIAGRKEERAFLWKAAGERGTLYLLGSPRYGAASFYPLPQIVTDAYGNAQAVVVEADIWNISDKEREALLKGRGRYEGKDSLENHVKQVTWDKVKEVGKKLGVNAEVLRQYKPWRAALLLETESLRQAGYTPELSVAQTFLKESQGRKPVEELGSKEEQVKQLEGLAEREQEQLLLDTLQELARSPDFYKNIADAWKTGDLEAMNQVVRQNYESDELGAKLFGILFEEGNEDLVNRLKEMAGREDRTLFVVVGVGRMGGEKGILKLLEGKKFTVTQP